ncbi:Chloramphenicol acetyltransferase-like domain-containing protein [Artemisia annua]|uniref:Chloramphenicol acetyltransferase-like domain-containing protein n=1 Tax=Artemisia annua TaxID=35608 RepID=A0A2U1KL26_ARTAN|nr:Chloramphenicol acetyltransferase-like domain-containing protein [Artemisia annua]
MYPRVRNTWCRHAHLLDIVVNSSRCQVVSVVILALLWLSFLAQTIFLGLATTWFCYMCWLDKFLFQINEIKTILCSLCCDTDFVAPHRINSSRLQPIQKDRKTYHRSHLNLYGHHHHHLIIPEKWCKIVEETDLQREGLHKIRKERRQIESTFYRYMGHPLHTFSWKLGIYIALSDDGRDDELLDGIMDKQIEISMLNLEQVNLWASQSCFKGNNVFNALERSVAQKKSLSKTLTQFYLLAGMVNNHLSIDCNDVGAKYILAIVQHRLGEFLGHPELLLVNRLLPFVPGFDESSGGYKSRFHIEDSIKWHSPRTKTLAQDESKEAVDGNISRLRVHLITQFKSSLSVTTTVSSFGCGDKGNNDEFTSGCSGHLELKESHFVNQNILESRNMPPGIKASLLAKIREYRNDLNILKSEIKILHSSNANVAEWRRAIGIKKDRHNADSLSLDS